MYIFLESWGIECDLIIWVTLLYLPTQIRFPIGGERGTCHGSKLTISLGRTTWTVDSHVIRSCTLKPWQICVPAGVKQMPFFAVMAAKLFVCSISPGVQGNVWQRTGLHHWILQQSVHGCHEVHHSTVCTKQGKPTHQSIHQSINQFINVKAWHEVTLHIRARGSCVKRKTIIRSKLTFFNHASHLLWMVFYIPSGW